MIERWGAVVARRARTVLLAAAALVGVAMFLGLGLEDDLSNGGFDDPASEAARELAVERETFGNKAIDAIAIFSDPDLEATDPGFRAAVEETLAAVPGDRVASVVSWYDTRDPSMLGSDGHAVAAYVSLAGDDQDEFGDSFEAIEPVLRDSDLTMDIAGPYAVYTDVNEVTKEDLLQAELVSLPIVLLLSIVIFRSLTAALMPVMVGVVAVIGARAVIAGLNQVTEVSIFAPNIITLLGLGLAIDYALFVVSRFREELALRPPDGAGGPAAETAAVREALTATMGTAGRTVLISGLTVAAAMSSLVVFPQAFVKSIGYGGMAAVLVAVVAALTVLPAVLVLLGRRIDSLRVPFLNRGRAVDPVDGAWARLARRVMRRPVLWIVAITVALLALASPFLGASWGSVDYRVLPPETPSHVAAEKLNTDFGPERSTANVLLRGADEADVAAYTRDLSALDGVVDVRPVESAGDTHLLRAAWEGNSQTEASQDLVRDLRGVPSPEGTEALVGGLTADTVDLQASIGAHLPWMGAIVVGVMLVLLFVAFGSVVLPVKAVLMNVLSITASFGVVTWIFSDGNLEGALGFTSAGYLDLTQPLVMAAILFGLSMDYEIFLLSRIKEQWDLTHDNELAVATGVQKTGRIITSAALLLGIVIGAFALSGVVFMKLIGIGMLVALFLDATVIRALLVPATMKLLGRWNWWAPAPMRRWYLRYGLREA
jgi:trehalose monomycolate/heme transporter